MRQAPTCDYVEAGLPAQGVDDEAAHRVSDHETERGPEVRLGDEATIC